MKLLLDHVLHLLIKLSQREWKEFQAESGIPSFDNRKGRDFYVLFVFLLTIHLFLLPTTLLAYADREDFKVGRDSANPDLSTCSLLSWSTGDVWEWLAVHICWSPANISPSPSSNDTLNSLVICFCLSPCSRDEPLIDLSHYILSSLDACSMMVK